MKGISDKNLSSIERCTDYCYEFPFSPGERYPEYPFNELSEKPNKVYSAVRNHLRNLGLDSDNFGTDRWNPFGEFDLVGKSIVIKPNWVKHYHPFGEDIWSVITHPSFIRVLLDYIYIATKGNCQVTVGDSPLQSTDFAEIIDISKMKEMQSYFNDRGMFFEIEDFRLARAIRDKRGNIIRIETLSEDPEKYCPVNLYGKSLHVEIEKSYKSYRVTNYDKRKMLKSHKIGYHEYLISNSVIKCDFFINIPKMKTHRKAGVTLSLKNLIGINCSKDCLPHHRCGAKSSTSDEYKKFYLCQWLWVFFKEWGEMYRAMILRRPLLLIGKLFRQIHRALRKFFCQRYYVEGSWYGNDTIWRTCLDLNKVILYSDKEGKINDEVVKRHYLTVIDGVLGGEKEAPLEPTPIKSEVTVAALNATVCDFVTAKLMGLDPYKIPIIRNSFSEGDLPIFKGKAEDIIVKSSDEELSGSGIEVEPVKRFEPSSGWKEHLELD